MNKQIITTLLALLLCSATALAQGVSFIEGPLQETLNKAKSENKLVFVDCYTSWCVPCAAMARRIFPDKVCGDYFNEKFVSTKFDMEKGEGAKLQKVWKCQSYPTFIILDSNGKEITRLMGATMTAEDFVTKVQVALAPDETIGKLKEAYEADKCMSTGFPYAKALFEQGHNVADLMEDIYRHSEEYDRYQTEFLQYYMYCIDFRSDKFDRLMADKQLWNERVGNETVDRIIWDSFRKTMYCVAAGRPHDLSNDDVRKAVMLTGFLRLPANSTEKYLPQLALCIVTKDWDGFIDLFRRRILPAPDDAYKCILVGFIHQYMKEMNVDQQKKIIDILDFHANSGAYQERSTKATIGSLKNITPSTHK